MGQAVPLIIMAAAAGAQAYNTHKTAKKQDQAALLGIKKQEAEQRKADARMDETLDYMGQEKTTGTEASMRQRYGDAARKKYAMAFQNIQGQPGADNSGTDAKRDSATGRTVDYGQFFADKYAKLDAPGDVRRLEDYERMDMGSDLSINKRNSRSIDNLTRMHVGSIQRNPWIDIAAAVANGAAGSMYGSGGSIAGAGQQNTGNAFKGAWSNYGYGQNPYIIGKP